MTASFDGRGFGGRALTKEQWTNRKPATQKAAERNQRKAMKHSKARQARHQDAKIAGYYPRMKHKPTGTPMQRQTLKETIDALRHENAVLAHKLGELKKQLQAVA